MTDMASRLLIILSLMASWSIFSDVTQITLLKLVTGEYARRAIEDIFTQCQSVRQGTEGTGESLF